MNPVEQIAIIGMGCRFPGGADTPAALWRLLEAGRDAVRERPSSRTELFQLASGLPGNLPAPSQAAISHGAFLDSVTEFDADFFGISRREADLIDPQHRLLLEVAWEALEHAGLPPAQLAGTSAGVYAGISYAEYNQRLNRLAEAGVVRDSLMSNNPAVAAGRISYLLGLHGPCLVLDTACSSALVAVHLACQALLARDCDLALAGGVALALSEQTWRMYTDDGMLSPTHHCHVFDADADGFVRGEGCGMVVLRRLADAVAAGERVLAVVRGTAVNQDGRTDGISAPSVDAQRAVYAEALARAGTDPADVRLIETHGTGTPVGDPAEFASLAAVYGPGSGPCALASIKTNLGHLEIAAGSAGLIKAVLCLQRGLIPPNLNFRRWHPALAADATRFFVPTKLTAWPGGPDGGAGGRRLAAVSSFGYSGTNAHAVLEQAPEVRPAGRGGRGQGRPAARPAYAAGPDVILVPAGSAAALPAAAAALAGWLDADGAQVPLRDVAYTLARRRSPGQGRLGVVAASRDDLARGLRAFAAGEAHPLVVSGAVGAGVSRAPVWVFSGQGSQWPGMGRGLLAADAAFAAALAEAEELIAAESGFSVTELIRSGAEVTGCDRVQPLLFAVQVALAAAWRAHGVEPVGVIGHSMGEIAAAAVAGALTMADAARVICRRSALLARISGAGAMASVSLDAAQVEPELGPGVSIAVISAPGSTVIAGDRGEVARLVAGWAARGIPAWPVAVDVAAHSSQIDPLLGDITEALADLKPRPPLIPFYSAVTGTAIRDGGPLLDAAYWCANLRRPVRFSAAIAAAAGDRRSVYVEVAPHPVVSRAIIDCLAGLAADPVVLHTLRREDDELTVFRTQLAALHCAGVPVDWAALYPAGELADVPPITLDRRRHWADGGPADRVAAGGVPAGEPAPAPPEAAAAASAGAAGPAEPLPGTHVEIPGDPARHCWHGDAGTDALPWLADHQVHGRPVLPAALSTALALTAGCTALGANVSEVELTGLRQLELLPLAGRTELSTTLTMAGEDRATCEVFGRDESGAWIKIMTAGVRRGAPSESEDPAAAPDEAWPPALGSPAGLYERLRACGISHGPAFAGVTGLRTAPDGDSAQVSLQLPPPVPGLAVSPVLLDICLQALAGLVATEAAGLILPTGARRIRVLGDLSAAAYCRAWIEERRADTVEASVRLLDSAGRALLALDGIQLACSAVSGVRLLSRTWPPASRELVQPWGDWLILAPAAAGGAAGELAAALTASGVTAEAGELPGAGVLARRWSGRPAPRGVVLMAAAGASAADSAAAMTAMTEVSQLLEVSRAMVTAWPRRPRLYVVTRGATAVRPSEAPGLAQAGTRGLIRVLACEHPDLRATQVDLGPADAAGRELAAELLADGREDEVALRGRDRYAVRLDVSAIAGPRAAVSTRLGSWGQEQIRLRQARPGDLGSLELAAGRRRRPGPGEVEIAVQAAGLNFRDVLTVLRALGPDVPADRIGFECAGTIVAAGPGVTGMAPGDHVLGFIPGGGTFASYVTGPAATVVPAPGGLPAELAVGTVVAFVTAWYALRHLARLHEGERVLIHSAAGGTGQAAVAVARLLGAEVLATAGSEGRRQFLRGQGIEHVMDSRSLDFAEQARAAARGEGVDVVLNSLSGPAIPAGLAALAPFGRFIELGERDILADAPLGMLALRENITFAAVNLLRMAELKPDAFRSLFQQVTAMLEAGQLEPLPTKTFGMADAADAFSLMTSAGHVGKITLTVPGHGQVQVAADQPVRPDGGYLVTGGLTGVGLETVRWLALGGAGHVVASGRRPPSPGAEAVLDELRTAGCRVSVELGDIAEPGTADRLVAAATSGGLALRGIVHSAMVLDDGLTSDITDAKLERTWQPKAAGAWRLHEAAAGHDLDWLVLYSSVIAMVGNSGQGAYASANSWLDGFATWRSAQGLPTLAVAWGPWGEIGSAAELWGRSQAGIRTEDGLRALGTLLAERRVHVGVLAGGARIWIPNAARDVPLVAHLIGDLAGSEPAPAPVAAGAAGGPSLATPADGAVLDALRAAAAGLPRRLVLESYLAGQIRGVLRLGSATIDPETPLRWLGFDSLLSLQLGSLLESGLGVSLPPKFVWTYPTIAALADALAGRLGVSLDAEPGLTGPRGRDGQQGGFPVASRHRKAALSLWAAAR